MSGEGMVAADPSGPPGLDAAPGMHRETIVAERAGVLGHAQQMARALDRLVARGGSDAGEVATVKRAILNFANDVAIGLHRDGPEDPGVRDAMKVVIKGQEVGDGVG